MYTVHEILAGGNSNHSKGTRSTYSNRNEDLIELHRVNRQACFDELELEVLLLQYDAIHTP